MVASGASSQAPEGLSLQRELDFQFQQGSHFGSYLGSILEDMCDENMNVSKQIMLKK